MSYLKMGWVIILLVLLLPFSTGCASLSQGSAVQTELRAAIDNIVIPIVQEATKETATRSGMLTGQISAIEPGLSYKITGMVGTGFTAHVVVNATGVSANIAGGTQADQGSDLTNPLVPPD